MITKKTAATNPGPAGGSSFTSVQREVLEKLKSDKDELEQLSESLESQLKTKSSENIKLKKKITTLEK